MAFHVFCITSVAFRFQQRQHPATGRQLQSREGEKHCSLDAEVLIHGRF